MPIQKIENNIHKTYETWIIENLSTTIAKTNSTEIPLKRVFSSEFEGNVTEWCVDLYEADIEDIEPVTCIEEIEVQIYPVGLTEYKKHFTCNFYLVDADGNLVFFARKNQRFDKPFFHIVERFIFDTYSYFPLKRTEKLVPNDTMTLHIELITYLDDNPTFPYERANYHVDVENLPQYFMELYEGRKDNGDIVIQVQDTQFKVHRTVVERRCPVLYDVARHQQTPEGTEFYITDIGPEIFERLLEFFYTGKINDLDDQSEYLLEAADRFELTRLKQLCEISLIDNYLTADNYKELEDLAVRCHAAQLKFNLQVFKCVQSSLQ